MLEVEAVADNVRVRCKQREDKSTTICIYYADESAEILMLDPTRAELDNIIWALQALRRVTPLENSPKEELTKLVTALHGKMRITDSVCDQLMDFANELG